MPIISAVGLFFYDKFEETLNEKVSNMSKLTKPYFSIYLPMPSKRSTKVFAMKNPHKKAKHIIIELEILLTFGGNNSAVTKKSELLMGS